VAVIDFAAIAARMGEAPAVRDRDRALSYAGLAERVASRAGALERVGLARGAGTRVALACARDIATVVDALALVALECAILPYNAAATPEEAERLFARFRPAWILRAPDREAVRWEGAAAARAAHPSLIDALPPLEIALALPSSGSTGTPKLILVGPAQLRARLEIRARLIGLTANDRVLAVIPFDHGYGFSYAMLASLAHGASITIAETADAGQSPHPRAIIEAARRHEVTLMPAPPILLDLLARFARADAAPPPAPLPLRAAISVGSALPRRVYDAFTATFGVPLWQSYGASEVGPTLLNTNGAADGELLALGSPAAGVDVSIRDENGAALADGEEGEIVVRSPGLAHGYEDGADGALIASSRFEGGAFWTGDLGVRAAGEFRFRGRRKVMIAVSGRKVDPIEVETVLMRHEGVADAAVTAHVEQGGREVVKAIIVPRAPHTTLDIVGVTDFCVQHLAAYKVPRVVEFREALPRTALGKLQRARL